MVAPWVRNVQVPGVSVLNVAVPAAPTTASTALEPFVACTTRPPKTLDDTLVLLDLIVTVTLLTDAGNVTNRNAGWLATMFTVWVTGSYPVAEIVAVYEPAGTSLRVTVPSDEVVNESTVVLPCLRVIVAVTATFGADGSSCPSILPPSWPTLAENATSTCCLSPGRRLMTLVIVRRPSAVTSIVYVRAGICRKLYRPSAPVVADAPVSWSVIVALASGPLVSSVTLPRMSAGWATRVYVPIAVARPSVTTTELSRSCST